LTGVLDAYPELATLAVVPLGISDHSNEPDMRPHTVDEARAVVDLVAEWQAIFGKLLGHRLVYAADEYFLLAEREFPPADTYEGFAMHEDGIGMARHFELELTERADGELTPQSGFFASVDGAPAEGYRAPRVTDTAGGPQPVTLSPSRRAPVGVITSEYGARVIDPLLAKLGGNNGGCRTTADVRTIVVDNRFFGGNIAVTGLLVGEDIARVLAEQPAGHRYLLPDVCLSGGLFLDGTSPDDLPRPVEVIATSGTALRTALGVRAPALEPNR
jgi:hypothetical protein